MITQPSINKFLSIFPLVITSESFWKLVLELLEMKVQLKRMQDSFQIS